MRRPAARRSAILCRVSAVAALLLALLSTGCGSETRPKPVALAILDETSSFRPFSPACVQDFLTVARGVASRRGHLYAGPLLTGDPYSERFSVDRDFDAPAPASIEGNNELERAYRARLANRLRGPLEAMTHSRPAIGGSPVLATLARASSFRQQRATNHEFWLVTCSDLANIGDGLDARQPINDTNIDRIVRRWAPRLKGLKGADLYFIGAGRLRPGSAARPDSVRQVERIIRALARAVGAHVRLVDTQLGQTFPLEGG